MSGKKIWSLAAVLFVVMCLSGLALAEEAAPAEAPQNKLGIAEGLGVAGACIGAGIAALGGGFAIARVGGQCIESMARQPEAAGSMFAPMIVTAAMIEGAMLFAIAVALMSVLGLLP